MMKMKEIGYWATTSIVALELLAGGVTDLVHGRTLLVADQPVAEVLEHLGYPGLLAQNPRSVEAAWSHRLACTAFSSAEANGRMPANSLQ